MKNSQCYSQLTELQKLKHLLQEILEIEDVTNIIDEDFAHETQARIEMIDEELEKFNN